MTFKIENLTITPGENAPTFSAQLKPIEPDTGAITLKESVKNAFQIHMINDFITTLNGGKKLSFTDLVDWKFAIDSAFEAIKGNTYRMNLNRGAAEDLTVSYIFSKCQIEQCI